MSQRDPNWFAARAGRITGSRFAMLMATTRSGPAASRRNLIAALVVERITGVCVKGFKNAAMERGIDLEPDARSAYEMLTGEFVEEMDFIVHPKFDFVGVSPDGLIGSDGMVELKCPDAMGKHLDALESGSHADEYKWQIQGQLWVAGREWNDAVSYDPRWPMPLDLAVKRVYRDENAIAELEAACIEANEEVNESVKKKLSMMNHMEKAA